MRISKFLLSLCAGALGASVANAGTLVASGDEWQLSDNAYGAQYVMGTQGFVTALANTFGGNNYLFLTGNGNIPQANLTMAAAQFQTLGKTVTFSSTFSLATASAYDAVFHFGQLVDPATIKAYVDGGKDAYISLGAGYYGNAAGEAAAWNPTLASYGLVAGSSWFSAPAFVSATVTQGPATSLLWGYGQSIDKLAGSPTGVSYIRGSFENGPTDIGLIGSSSALGVAGVPEPAAWSLLILGFGAIGGAMRARTRKAVTSRLTLRIV